MGNTKTWSLNQVQIDEFANVTGMLAEMALHALHAGHVAAAENLTRTAEKLGQITNALVATNMAPPFNKGDGLGG